MGVDDEGSPYSQVQPQLPPDWFGTPPEARAAFSAQARFVQYSLDPPIDHELSFASHMRNCILVGSLDGHPAIPCTF